MAEVDEMWAPATSWLFCPADRPERYAKALAVAQIVIIDLEDAVGPGNKAEARVTFERAVRTGVVDLNRVVVRINASTDPEHEEDLRLVERLEIPTVMLAKAEHLESIESINATVIALIESALGAEQVSQIATASNVRALMWGADDLTASMGGSGSRFDTGDYSHAALHVRSRVLIAAKARNIAALDAVLMDLDDDFRLHQETREAVAMGFDAKVAIHPRQVPIIKRAYQPTVEELGHAREVMAAAAESGGVATVAGRMVDGPIYKQAQAVIARAEQSGFVEPCLNRHSNKGVV